MKLGKFTLGFAAAALVAGPVLAQAALAPSVAPLSGDESEISSSAAIILGVIAAGAVIGGVIASSGGDDNEIPVSG